jgi:hypothetical protein
MRAGFGHWLRSIWRRRIRLLATAIAPVLVLLIVDVLNNEQKCLIVYWRPYRWLPGCEAFSKYAAEDMRIDMTSLRKNVGPFPTDPREQNAKWYKLFKRVEAFPEVEGSNLRFLMYRDMAALSLPFIGLAPLALFFAGATPKAQWIGAGIFFFQYLATAVSAGNRGRRLVRNVLAIHSAQKIVS